MKEIDQVIAAYEEASKLNRRVILATVVHVEGSSYRRASARMLVDELGYMTGAISGGCLEGDALRKALNALNQNQNKLVTYDTSDEEDAVVGAQLGCNGVIQVLFEPIDAQDEKNPIELLKKARASQPAAVLTFFDLSKKGAQLGTQLMVQEGKELYGKTTAIAEVQKRIEADAKRAFAVKGSLFLQYVGTQVSTHAFIEYLSKPIHLVIAGAGHDAQIMAQLAEPLGWNITVVDGRSTHAIPERFVPSCQVMVSKPEAILDSIELHERTVFVLLTHNYNYDLAVLKLLVEQSQLPYVGILGPKKKFNRMLDELKAAGIELTEEQLKRIYAPVGLQIGAETPAEIALSILSEIQAVLNRSGGGFLKALDGPIHSKKNNEFEIIDLDE